MNIFLKRMITFLLCAVLLFGQVAMGVDASWGIEEHVETAVHINPLYADHITEDDLRPVDMVAPVTTDDVVYHTTIAEAGAEMREAMKARKGTIVVHYQTENYDFMQYKDILMLRWLIPEILRQAMPYYITMLVTAFISSQSSPTVYTSLHSSIR